MMYGISVASMNDPLHPIEIDLLAAKIKQPKAEMVDFLDQLRSLRSLDPKQYRELKKRLPYFVAGVFQPGIRKKDYFVSTRYCILDIDHVGSAEDVSLLKQRVAGTEGLVMAFSSPGGDGLKLIFKFQRPCTDATRYAIFYRHFAAEKARIWQVESQLDIKTSDVSRACFFSHDPEIWVNIEAVGIDWESYAPEEQADWWVKSYEEVTKQAEKQTLAGEPEEKGIGQDVLLKIKEKLGQLKPKQEKQHYQPAALEAIMPVLSQQFAEMGVQITINKPIAYGKQLQLSDGKQWAELNLFHGKRGFSVVRTTKTGSSETLGEALKSWMEAYLNQL